MYTSDIDTNKKNAARTSLVYLIIALFCALLGAIYELFSHEVYSYYMIYAFAFPLALGTLPFQIISVAKTKGYPHTLSRKLYHSGIAALTVGSIVRGVLDIYGTTNALSNFYWIFGALLVLAGIATEIIFRLNCEPNDID